MSLFDNIQKTAINTVNKVYSVDAIWIRSDGGENVTGKALFKEPTDESELIGHEYTPFTYIMEYFTGDFIGLCELARGNDIERINIDGSIYTVRTVKALFDGKTYKAILDKLQ